jgi:hypothetical protein
MVMSAAEVLSQELVEACELDVAAREHWISGVRRWQGNKVAANNVREQIQRHLDIVELELADNLRDAISRHVKLLVFRVDSNRIESLSSRSLTQLQRDGVWDRMQLAIRPGTLNMFCTSLREAVAEVLTSYSELPPTNAQQATLIVARLLDAQFGWNGSWRTTFSVDKNVVVEAIVNSIMIGFEDIIKALLETEQMGSG